MGPLLLVRFQRTSFSNYNFVPLLYIQSLSSRPPIQLTQPDLRQKIPRRMPHMIVRKRRHCEITVIITVLPSHIHFPFALGRFDEILGQQLALFVEIVARADVDEHIQRLP